MKRCFTRQEMNQWYWLTGGLMAISMLMGFAATMLVITASGHFLIVKPENHHQPANRDELYFPTPRQ